MVKLQIENDKNGEVIDVIKSAILAKVTRMEMGLKQTDKLENLRKSIISRQKHF